VNKLFEYCIIYHQLQTKEQKEKGEAQKSILVQDVKRIVARDEKAAQTMAARELPEEYLDKLDQVEIAIRPF
jgi:peptidase E